MAIHAAMGQRMRRAAIALLVALVALPAVAADLYCAGTFKNVLMYSTGRVMALASWRNDWVMLCDGPNAWGGIDQATCLAWYATAVKAQAAGSNVSIWYTNAGGYSCATIPIYGSSLPPVYLRVDP